MASVARVEYIVEREGNHWTVRLCGGDCAGRFASRKLALLSAIRDADRVRNLGHEVHISAQRADGTLRRISDHLHAQEIMIVDGPR